MIGCRADCQNAKPIVSRNAADELAGAFQTIRLEWSTLSGAEDDMLQVIGEGVSHDSKLEAISLGPRTEVLGYRRTATGPNSGTESFMYRDFPEFAG